MYLNSGIVPTKSEWRCSVNSAIDDEFHSKWRFLLSLYPKLDVYRVVVQRSSLLCWWEMVKYLPFLKKSCILIVILLSGSHILKVAQQIDTARQFRICDNCNSGKNKAPVHTDITRWESIYIKPLLSKLVGKMISCSDKWVVWMISDDWVLVVIYVNQPFYTFLSI